jgi:shikimate dehydrogenase
MKKQNFAIIGNPVSHSLSPDMHNAAFRERKLPHHYSKIRLTTEELPSFFNKLRKGNFRGINVTVPHKEAVMAYLDETSPEARLIGAVNTISVENGKLKGFNTDGAGYLQSLKKETGFILKGKRIVLLGAGGAARAILAACLSEGVRELTLANRTLERAQKLALEFQKKFPRAQIKTSSLKTKNLEKIFKRADLLINTTSAGLKDEPFPYLPLHFLPRRALVSDILYQAEITPLLREAKKLKRKIHRGLGMLLHQGALAFEIWTQQKAPLSLMKKTLKEKLRLKITQE